MQLFASPPSLPPSLPSNPTGMPVNFNVSINPAENYPLDLYFLMDLSSSLQDDLVTLRNISTQLSKW